jgi:hypothetical protein
VLIHFGRRGVLLLYICLDFNSYGYGKIQMEKVVKYHVQCLERCREDTFIRGSVGNSFLLKKRPVVVPCRLLVVIWNC